MRKGTHHLTLGALAPVALSALTLALPVHAQKFYPDDPLTKEPPPVATIAPEGRELSEVLEFFSNTFGDPGERHPERGVIPAGGINTLGEVMDGPWYVNRHAIKRMTRQELIRGPGDDLPPSRDGKWKALVVKSHGLRPGILMRDPANQLYLLRFDPAGFLEMGTGATMVASRALHALGYYVPENYIVYFDRDQIVAAKGGEDVTSMGQTRDLTEENIDNFLKEVARHPQKGYRAVATRAPAQWKGMLGPYQVYGTRSDDPNDIVPHEHRRDLRGLYVFSAWLNHTNMRAMNTLDVVVEDGGTSHIRHYLIDFTATLGSHDNRPKRVWEGNDPGYDRGRTAKNVATFGIYTPRWMRADFPGFRSVGHFEYETFDPEKWTPVHEIAPFANRLPDDTFWAARKLAAFTNEDIEAIVSAGHYSDSEAEAWIAKCLIARRNRILRTYFSQVLPLDNFRIEANELKFNDLELEESFVTNRAYNVRWLELDNETGVLSRLEGPKSFTIPSRVMNAEPGSYYAARIGAEDRKQHEVTVYLRRDSYTLNVVGLDYSWPGKVIAHPAKDIDTGRSRYADLQEQQRTHFGPYTDLYNEKTGRNYVPQEYFDSLTISERTTYDAVTHALMNSQLTDEQGVSLGVALDLVKSLERIAGQYYGRGGDQQFRLYVNLEPGAGETLEKSQEFFRDHLNTVYHAGYPHSFRQTGKEPTIQFSISEDEKKADIDVDYRSSKSPQALFNGHLTSANSDVRQGDNHERHSVRWSGLHPWWAELFGKLPSGDKGARDLYSAEVPELPTPTPPDRPRNAQIPEIHDAVQEFLSDWLVRANYDEAVDFLSDHAMACLNMDDDAGKEALDARGAREHLREIMEYSAKEMGDRDNLTEAVDAVKPWNKTRVLMDHPYSGDFALAKMSKEDAEPYLCGQERPQAAAEYYGVLFRFKDVGGAVLGLSPTAPSNSDDRPRV
jgi:hypothetical protein